MGHSYGFRWEGKPLERLKELTMLGLPLREIAKIMSKDFNYDISYAMVCKEKSLHNILNCFLEEDSTVKTYKELTLPMDNYMISCDYHSPWVNTIFLNLFLAIAERFGIKKNIIIGDLFEYHFIMQHYTEVERSLDKEIAQTAPVIKALDYFDENTLLQGNHERRIGIQTNSLIQAKHLFGLFGAEIWAKKFKYSIYDKLNIGDKWMLVHPQSYSQISPRVAVRLAEKYHKNIINSHGHLVGSTYDRSGKFQAIDLGNMIDKAKVDYINLRTTTHPMWKNGFGMLRNGHFYHFREEADWNFWLKGDAIP